jgi:hypothetical protein
MPMPTIIFQIPSVRMILSHDFGNEHYSGSNSKCTRCGHPQSEEDEVDNDDMDEEIDEDGVNEEVVDEDDMKKEEIKEEMIFEYSFNEQNDSNKYALRKDVNLNESPLSSSSEANIKDEIYYWEQFSIENT